MMGLTQKCSEPENKGLYPQAPHCQNQGATGGGGMQRTLPLDQRLLVLQQRLELVFGQDGNVLSS